jgi:hypothetical protein
MNDNKETAVYPATEMIFDPVLNLLDYQFHLQNCLKTFWKKQATLLYNS